MISDPRWEESYIKGKIIEEGVFGDYRMVLMKIDEPIGVFYYPYRMFFFKNSEYTPILILSLEIGRIYGTCALGAHDETMHRNFGDADENMSVEEFREWALTIARKELSQNAY